MEYRGAKRNDWSLFGAQFGEVLQSEKLGHSAIAD
jgi:hypothetical protein